MSRDRQPRALRPHVGWQGDGGDAPFARCAGRGALVEYVVIHDINDSPECARECGRLLAGSRHILNLIPYNPTDVPFAYAPPDPERVREFSRIVHEEFRVQVTIRKEKGRDVSAACGQLVLRAPDGQRSAEHDVEDICGGTAPRRRTPGTQSRHRRLRESLAGRAVARTWPGLAATVTAVVACVIGTIAAWWRLSDGV